jgi:dihydropteroate synthase
LGDKQYSSYTAAGKELPLARIGGVAVGGSATKVMGIINVSPESFYKGSVKTGEQEIAGTAKEMEQAGAHIIDIGAMSTAPYLDTLVSMEEEARRMAHAIHIVKDSCNLPISADTPRAEVAEQAIAAGADAINDVTGLKYDAKLARVVAKAKVPVIIGAYSSKPATGKMPGTIRALKESLAIAKKAGIKGDSIIIDPSIGFFRGEGKSPFFTKMTDMPWYLRDMQVLSNLDKLAALKKPVCVSVSRKSFIGHLLNLQTEDRMVPSVACEIIATLNGASLVRTHNVRETVQALTMLQLLSH